jgi:hypothetical protein
MFDYGTKFAGLGYGVFPNFAAKNASGPTATDGFPYTADSVNDWIGFTQDLLYRAGLIPNGNAEAAGSSQLINALMRGAAQRPGDFVMTAIPQERMAENRILLLAGQISSITGEYSRLAANVYVGDAANPDAAAFYKCDAAGVRSISGAYMKMPDARGVGVRGAGVNSEHLRADGTPYDGKSIGEHIPDAIQNITGQINLQGYDHSALWIDAYGAFYGGELAAIRSVASGPTAEDLRIRFFLDASRVVRAANETRGPTISMWFGISY